MKNDDLDIFISRNLEKLELDIPPEVQDNVRQRLAALADRPRPAAWKRIVLWAPVLAAALLIIIVSISMLFPHRPEIKKITQIRTEFSIPEKNIKIVWVQRDDFQLPETKG
ncbi:MAG: DUF3999 domain-containing protein [Candidatus Aminicenantes bacterium]|nr:DUF3999 domain-containing protein [Candidatus Aminicenantes bacterium]